MYSHCWPQQIPIKKEDLTMKDLLQGNVKTIIRKIKRDAISKVLHIFLYSFEVFG